jgi:tRNA threonylcarbamoyladenosine biosynthesis protein TsaE
MNLQILTTGAEETRLVGAKLGKLLAQRSRALVLLSGPLGAGKTTLVQGLAKALGVSDPVTSPTFVTCLEYQGEVTLHHIDAWRVAEDAHFATEVLAIFEQPGICVVEWPEQMAAWLPDEYLNISLAYDFSQSETWRRLVLRGEGGDYVNIVEEMAKE